MLHRLTCGLLLASGLGMAAVEAPALVGPSDAGNWNGTTLNDLAERIRVSMPADDPGSLSRRSVADVVAYMLSAGGFPAGEFVLDRQAEVLSRIRYLSADPR